MDETTTIARARWGALLAEYKDTRENIRHHQGVHVQLVMACATLFTAAFGAALLYAKFDVLLLLPLVAAIFGYRWSMSQVMIIMASHYGLFLEGVKAQQLLGRAAVPEKTEWSHMWLGWQHFYSDCQPPIKLYRPFFYMFFVAAPFLPAVAYCGVRITSAAALGLFPRWGYVLALLFFALLAYAIHRLNRQEKAASANLRQLCRSHTK